MAQHVGADAAAGERHGRDAAGGLQVDQPGDQPGRGRRRQQFGSAVNHHLTVAHEVLADRAARLRPGARPDAGTVADAAEDAGGCGGAAPFGLASGEAASLATVPGADPWPRGCGGPADVPFVRCRRFVRCCLRSVALRGGFRLRSGARPWSRLLVLCRWSRLAGRCRSLGRCFRVLGHQRQTLGEHLGVDVVGVQSAQFLGQAVPQAAAGECDVPRRLVADPQLGGDGLRPDHADVAGPAGQDDRVQPGPALRPAT